MVARRAAKCRLRCNADCIRASSGVMLSPVDPRMSEPHAGTRQRPASGTSVFAGDEVYGLCNRASMFRNRQNCERKQAANSGNHHASIPKGQAVCVVRPRRRYRGTIRNLGPSQQCRLAAGHAIDRSIRPIDRSIDGALAAEHVPHSAGSPTLRAPTASGGRAASHSLPRAVVRPSLKSTHAPPSSSSSTSSSTSADV